MIIYSDHDSKNDIIIENYSLFLDDIRIPIKVTHAWHKGKWEEFPSLYNWIVVRSFEEFVNCIKQYHLPKRASFDHDLSWEDTLNAKEEDEGPLDYSRFKEKTGYEAAQWLVDYCLQRNVDIPEFFVHSFNPVGRMNIINLLTHYPIMREKYNKTKK